MGRQRKPTLKEKKNFYIQIKLQFYNALIFIHSNVNNLNRSQFPDIFEYALSP